MTKQQQLEISNAMEQEVNKLREILEQRKKLQHETKAKLNEVKRYIQDHEEGEEKKLYDAGK